MPQTEQLPTKATTTTTTAPPQTTTTAPKEEPGIWALPPNTDILIDYNSGNQIKGHIQVGHYLRGNNGIWTNYRNAQVDGIDYDVKPNDASGTASIDNAIGQLRLSPSIGNGMGTGNFVNYDGWRMDAGTSDWPSAWANKGRYVVLLAYLESDTNLNNIKINNNALDEDGIALAGAFSSNVAVSSSPYSYNGKDYKILVYDLGSATPNINKLWFAYTGSGSAFIDRVYITNTLPTYTAIATTNAATTTVTAKSDAKTVIMRLDNLHAAVNGVKVRVNDAEALTPIMNQGGRTMVPFRFIATCFGADVDWDGGSGSAIIDYKGKVFALRCTLERQSGRQLHV